MSHFDGFRAPVRAAGPAWLFLFVVTTTLSPLSAQEHSAEFGAMSDTLSRLLSPDPADHQVALAELVDLGDTAVPTLEALAVDPSQHPRWRSGAVYALGRIGASDSESVLSAMWASGFEVLGGALAMQTALALAEYGQYDALIEVVGAGDEVLGAKAAIQLGLWQVASARPILAEAYEGEVYARMRPFFAIALGLLGDEGVATVLRSALTTPELRNHCAIALSALGFGSEVRFELEFGLADSDPLVRLRALEGLIEVAPRSLEDLLASAAEDSDARVRARALRALERARHRDRRRR